MTFVSTICLTHNLGTTFKTVFNTVDGKSNFPMTGFKSQISGVGGNHSTNWATTTALYTLILSNITLFKNTVTYIGICTIVTKQEVLVYLVFKGGEPWSMWSIFLSFWQFLVDFFSIMDNFELTLSIFICHWVNFHCWKMAKYWRNNLGVWPHCSLLSGILRTFNGR